MQVLHYLVSRFFFVNGFVSNTHAAAQIKPPLNILRLKSEFPTDTHPDPYADTGKRCDQEDETDEASFKVPVLFHDFIIPLLICTDFRTLTEGHYTI